ncbi:acyl-CoA reductase [Pararhodonellum marinum]|uniref:acyl-CoA reductase n=1 Tax=Pararhodonellum marinum TaxID=2755358 RepID=UPI00188DF0C8|nr:acyl-CoA reductase [Pararhodonellum marinum]
MVLKERIEAFVKLKERIVNLQETEFMHLASKIENSNNWFTPNETKKALDGIGYMLEEEKLRNWLSKYFFQDQAGPKNVGVLMAGNIPAVGFHDFMCVLLSGHRVHAKLSSSDGVLIRWLAGELVGIEPRFSENIIFEEMLKGKDAYIATGSDNSARYFEYYFGKYPCIIRKNRTSIGVLNGMESDHDYKSLAEDIFTYFGLGCRNVSKIYLKNRDQLPAFMDAIQSYSEVGNHHKYRNNYDYNKSIYLINQVDHLDNGFLLVKESEELVSPISVLFYEIYNDFADLTEKITGKADSIQCMVSKEAWFPNSLPFGKAQYPEVNDYADQVDTLAFLTSL